MLERLYLVPFVPIGTASSQTLTFPTTFWTILSQCLPLGTKEGRFGTKMAPLKHKRWSSMDYGRVSVLHMGHTAKGKQGPRSIFDPRPKRQPIRSLFLKHAVSKGQNAKVQIWGHRGSKGSFHHAQKALSSSIRTHRNCF